MIQQICVLNSLVLMTLKGTTATSCPDKANLQYPQLSTIFSEINEKYRTIYFFQESQFQNMETHIELTLEAQQFPFLVTALVHQRKSIFHSQYYKILKLTKLNGYWYEHLYVKIALNNDACSHFQITCDINKTSCTIQNVEWQSYLLMEIWNGTITEKDKITNLVISRGKETSDYEINIRFQDNAVLIWSCSDNASLVFASLLIRMDTDEDMEKTWEAELNNMNYMSIINDFPAGIWKKVDPSECLNSGGLQTFSSRILVAILPISVLIQKKLLKYMG